MSSSLSNDFAILDDLMRLVLRAFYSDENCIVAEVFLQQHRAISDEELARIVKLNVKQVRKYLSRLKEDQLLACVIKKEEKFDAETGEALPGKKWQQQAFYYVDYKRFVDCVKYRIHQMEQKLGADDSTMHTQFYVCPRCKKRYSSLDAGALMDVRTGQLKCERDKTELVEEDAGERADRTTGRKSSMMAQITPIIEQLKKTDKIVLPRIPIADLTKRNAVEEEGEDGTKTILKPSSFLPNADRKFTVELSGDKKERVKDTTPKEPGAAAPQTITVDTDGGNVKVVPPWLLKKREEEEKAAQNSAQAVEQTVDIMVPKEEEKPEESDYLRKYAQELQESNTDDLIMEEPEATDDFFEPVSGEEETVKVGDRQVPISQITEEDKEKMTPEEYTEYYEKLAKMSGMGGGDEDDFM
eukprot:TRINITY_DN4505_c0_g1_i2.p1 TRINITY_DN4505_c0_g1~~TRINITY_DN4505_c0_g1_i2.p1  ORF type:complete len:413 (+),score=152.21 TRINITY_DN4505_c0_g1_i2:1037-2275(+)